MVSITSMSASWLLASDLILMGGTWCEHPWSGGKLTVNRILHRI